jgi:dTDP-4-amino-4,6-dideoxygalactose transaminase
MTDRSDVVPLANPRSDNAVLRSQIIDAATRVLDGGRYILGDEVKAFESALAAQTNSLEAIGVASGTDALVLSLLACGIGAGDEVITVSHTAGPTVAAINAIGAVPVFIDVRSDTYCLDPALLEQGLSPRTRAIIAVHLYGHPADVLTIKTFSDAQQLYLIEDCAQAQGAESFGQMVGSIGNVGCFSFYPTKNLGAIGDGGAVTTRDLALANRLRKLRTFGWSEPQFAAMELGRCSRLDEIQAAILNAKLPYVGRFNQRRRDVAAQYKASFSELPLQLPVELPGNNHVYHLFVVASDKRDELERHLSEKGIMTGRHYPYPVHVQPGLADRGRVAGSLSVTEKLQHTILSLPIFGTIADAQVERVIEAVQSFFK